MLGLIISVCTLRRNILPVFCDNSLQYKVFNSKNDADDTPNLE
jgi:hypothetical protein